MGYIRTGPAFSKKDLCYAPSRCSEPFKSPCLYMESQKYQGSYSACPTPRFKSRSTNLKDLLFAWRKEFCGRESRDSSVAYQQPDPGQGSHLTSLHFRLLAGETGKLTRDANLHERYSADESHRTRGHGAGLRRPPLHFCAPDLPAGPWVRRRRGRTASHRRAPLRPPPRASQAVALGLGVAMDTGSLVPLSFHCEGPVALCPLLGTGTPASPASAGPRQRPFERSSRRPPP